MTCVQPSYTFCLSPYRSPPPSPHRPGLAARASLQRRWEPGTCCSHRASREYGGSVLSTPAHTYPAAWAPGSLHDPAHSCRPGPAVPAPARPLPSHITCTLAPAGQSLPRRGPLQAAFPWRMAALSPNKTLWQLFSGTQGLHPHTFNSSVHFCGPTYRQGLPLPMRPGALWPEERTGCQCHPGLPTSACCLRACAHGEDKPRLVGVGDEKPQGRARPAAPASPQTSHLREPHPSWPQTPGPSGSEWVSGVGADWCHCDNRERAQGDRGTCLVGMKA